MKRIALSFALLLAFTAAFPASAQEFSAGDIALTLSPAHPKAGQPLSASVSATAFDINRANISWYKNGKLATEGIGKKSADFGITDPGQTVINVVVAGTDFTLSKTIRINPSLVSLAWQSDSSVPPFSRGKALSGPQGTITFVAMPFFTRSGSSLGASDQISYSWKKDGKAFADMSGYGKNTFVVRGDVTDEPVKIEVTAENIATGETGYAEATVRSEIPKIVFYENHPLYGLVLNKALPSNVTLTEPEISLFAAPFFASSGVVWNWSMNDAALEEKGPSITLRTKEGTSGISRVTAEMQNSAKFLQNAAAAINLGYTAAPKSAFNTTQ